MTLVIRNDGSGLFLFSELLLTGVPTGHGVPNYLPVFRTTSPPVFRKSAEKNAEKSFVLALKQGKNEENTSEHPLLQKKRRKKKMKTKQKWAKGKGIWWNTDTPRSGTPMLAVGTLSSIGTPVVRTIKKFAPESKKEICRDNNVSGQT